MKCLLLGGNGFIGSHLVQELNKKGFKIRIFDKAASKIGMAKQGIEILEGKFDDKSDLIEALYNVDVVIHLISTTLPSTSNVDPIVDIRTNLETSVNLFQQMKYLGIKRIVFISSGGTVYGNPRYEKVSEEHPLNPICSYGICKVAIEKYLFMFQELHNFKPIILRPSNPYGPYQGHTDVQGVISSFLSRVANDEDVKIWGDGSIVRDYIYIDDLVEIMCEMINSEKTGVYNVGSGVGISLNDIITTINKITGKKVGTKYMAGRPFDVKRLVLDISKVQNNFKWKPKITTVPTFDFCCRITC